MNKYQEALDKVLEIATYGEVMNETYNSLFHSNVKKIQELVDKATPKKPIKLTYKLSLDDGWNYECPRCECAVGINTKAIDYTQEEGFCQTCGQALDWSKDEK